MDNKPTLVLKIFHFFIVFVLFLNKFSIYIKKNATFMYNFFIYSHFQLFKKLQIKKMRNTIQEYTFFLLQIFTSDILSV